MRHIIAQLPEGERDSAEDGIVHYEGAGIIGSHTLCGHTDRVGWCWQDTAKRVNCSGCVGVRNHVLGKN